MPNQHRPRPIRVHCPSGTEYDEETFTYFLGIEQARAARDGHQLRLLLATIEPPNHVPFPRAGAVRFFDALRLSLRDTDVMVVSAGASGAWCSPHPPVPGPRWS